MASQIAVFRHNGIEYKVDVARIMAPEAMAIEENTKMGFPAVMKALANPDAPGWTTAILAIYFIARKRSEPTVKWADAIADVVLTELAETMALPDAEVGPDPTEAGTPAWKDSDGATSDPSLST